MDSAEATLDRFTSAFNALDLDAMCACLADDISLFAPQRSGHGLVEGLDEVRAHFAGVLQAEAPSGPAIRPTNIRIRQHGTNGAIVTFEFDRGGGSIGRRTLVLRQGPDDWLIAHIHASNTEA